MIVTSLAKVWGRPAFGCGVILPLTPALSPRRGSATGLLIWSELFVRVVDALGGRARSQNLLTSISTRFFTSLAENSRGGEVYRRKSKLEPRNLGCHAFLRASRKFGSGVWLARRRFEKVFGAESEIGVSRRRLHSRGFGAFWMFGKLSVANLMEPRHLGCHRVFFR
jgi:hypothetical protein